MPGITLKINRKDLNKVLEGIADRMTDSTAAMRKVGAIVRESIRTNFARSGRPDKWAKLQHRKGQALRDTNRLMNSITSVPAKNSVRVGTNVVYAGVHNYGAKKGEFGTFTMQVGPHYRTSKGGKRFGVRGHARKVKLPWGDIPARPFILVQKEDGPEISAILAKHIIKGE
jgi:phage virion morphogenesis protein